MSDDHTDHEQGSPELLATSKRWGQIWASRTMLLRVARKRCANVEDAEDVVQEAMLRAAQHPEVSDDGLQPWLIAVTTRLCVDAHRRRANEAGRWARAGARPEVDQFGQHPEEEACDRSEAVWVASKATELLPPRQAEALHLTAAGCDVQQVASQLGVNYRAAESLLARARRTLRAALAAGVGAMAWAWRTPATAVSNSGPVALASAALAVVVVAVPVALSPIELSDLWPPTTGAEPNPHGTSVIQPQDPSAPPTQGPGPDTEPTPHPPDPGLRLPLHPVPGLGQVGDLGTGRSPLPSGVSVPSEVLPGDQLNPPPPGLPPPDLPPPDIPEPQDVASPAPPPLPPLPNVGT